MMPSNGNFDRMAMTLYFKHTEQYGSSALYCHLHSVDLSKTEVPRDIRNSKSGNITRSGKRQVKMGQGKVSGGVSVRF